MSIDSGRTWRLPVFYRVFFPVIGLYFLVSTVLWFDRGSDLPGTALSLLLGLALTVGPFRPVVRLGPHELYVRGLLLHRRIPLQDVAVVEGSYDGLMIETGDGKRFTATGVGEKFRISRWLGRRGQADVIAETILHARDHVLAAAPQEVRQEVASRRPPEPPEPPGYMAAVQVVATAVFLVGGYLALISGGYGNLGFALMALGVLVPASLLLWSQRRHGGSGG